MPKPLTTGALSLGDVYGSVAQDLMQRIGDAQAAAAGPPIGDDIAIATDADRVEAWWARRPEATDQAMLALAQQKYAEHKQQGMDDQRAQAATAEDLTHFRYGQRLKLYTYGQVGFKSQVEEARRLRRLAARETTPNPDQPPPSMPSAQLTNVQATGQPAAAVAPTTGANTVGMEPTVEGPGASSYGP